MRLACWLFIFLAVSVTTHAVANNERIAHIDVLGISGDEKTNVELFLQSMVGQTISTPLVREIKEQTQQAVKVFGYYNPKISISRERTATGIDLDVNVDLGTVTRINNVVVTVHGQAKDDNEFIQQVNLDSLKPGQSLLHSDYEALKNAISSALLELGYFDANWEKSELLINKERNSADVTLIINSHARYRYGDIVIDNSLAAAKYIRSMNTLKSGEFYKTSEVSEFNLALADTPYFRSVRVYPDLANKHNNIVPINVDVLAKPNNSYEVGGGASTDQGAKVRFKWTKPWLTSDGHYLETNIEATQIEQQARFTYTVPVDDPNDDVWRYAVGYLNDENKFSKKYTTQLQRQWLTQDKWVRTAFIKHESERYRIGEENFQSDMYLPGISYARKRSRGGTTPYWGDQWLFSIEMASESLYSSTDLVKAQLQHQLIRTYFDKHMLLTRLNLGAIYTDDIDEVPVSMRFFAGGDKSIRGYKYESIGPRIDDEVVGGQYLATGTLEYNYRFLPSWRAALFVDGGTATNDFKDEIKIGAGIGLRWLTPIGPIRIDHAWQVTSDHNHTRLSITIGPEL